jgi:hypothetical protein
MTDRLSLQAAEWTGNQTMEARTMRKFNMALAAATALIATASSFSSAEAAPIAGARALLTMVDSRNMIEDAHYVWAGRGYCWYGDGWKGSGWYRCGYASRSGQGWGGPQGWHGWYWQGPNGPRHWGHHGSRHHYWGGCCW